MVCAVVRWWGCDHGLHGDVNSGFVHMFFGVDVLHGFWSCQWHELHVHGDGDKRAWHWFGVGCLIGNRSLDGPWCPNWCVCDVGCEWSVGCFVVCSGQQRWGSDHGLHGDIDTGFVELHIGDDFVHGFWSCQWHELHVHGDGDECSWHWCCLGCVCCCCSLDGPWRTYLGLCDVFGEQSVGCFVDGS